MIDPKSSFQPPMPLETRTTFQPHMPLDKATLSEAICLAIGLRLKTDDKPRPLPIEHRQKVREIRALAMDAIDLGTLSHIPPKNGDSDPRVRPAEFLAWAVSREIQIPEELRVLVGPPTQDALGTKERTTLLLIIGLLAKQAEIDVEKSSKAAQVIVSLADAAGVRLGIRTVEEHLRKIPDAFERRER